jgi:hypothetical protein
MPLGWQAKRLQNEPALVAFGVMKRLGQSLPRGVISLLSAVLALLPCAAHAERSPLAFESTYLGNGWFEYSVITTDDPFFLFLDVTGAGVQFGPAAEVGPAPPRWTNLWDTNFVSWRFDGIGFGDQIRPYRATFRVRSAHTSYKRASAGGMVLMSLAIVGGYHGQWASGNIVGYWIPEALVPCPPGEADGSATNLLQWCPMINGLPEPRLVNLIQSGGGPVGVAFEYPELSTVRLEGTRDFRAWTNVAYIHGAAGVTPWTTNVSLSNYGDFFRLRLVAEGHAINLPPLETSSPMLAQTKTVREYAPKLRASFVGGPIELTIENVSGGKWTLIPLDSKLQRAEASPLSLGGGAVTVPAALRQAPVGFFAVREVH